MSPIMAIRKGERGTWEHRDKVSQKRYHNMRPKEIMPNVKKDEYIRPKVQKTDENKELNLMLDPKLDQR